MGNQLSFQVPSLEFYLADLDQKLTIERSLGFNKFIKTLQCVPAAVAGEAAAAAAPHKHIVKVYIKKRFTAADQRQAALDAAGGEAAAIVLNEAEMLDESELIARTVAKLVECKRRLEEEESGEKEQQQQAGDSANVATFERVVETDKAVYLLRPFFYKSLKDRVSSRPFFSADEKRWMVFQLLRALRACAARAQPHGDVSLENLMVTPTGWLCLLDFACAKPTLIDINNPSIFSLYFDSSNSRRCAIAPERFVPLDQCDAKAPLTHAMDLFSAGCAVFELFTGAPLFNLSTLLQYKRDEFSPHKLLAARIDDERVRRLILTLIDKEPAKRLSAAEHLLDADLFPPQFAVAHAHAKRILFHGGAHTDDKAAMLIQLLRGGGGGDDAAKVTVAAAAAPVVAPAALLDEAEVRIDIGAELSQILKILDGSSAVTAVAATATAAAAATTTTTAVATTAEVAPDPLVALLLLPFALAFVRHCSVRESRLRVIALLQSLEATIEAPLFVGRVLPFSLVLLSDRDPVVRLAALRLCVSAFERGCADASAYTTHLALDFALPRLLALGQEESEELVLASLLARLPSVAKSAKLYLEQQLKYLSEKSEIAYDAELQHLTESLYGLLTGVLGRVPTSSVVKRALFADILELAIFFGRRKTVDLLIPLLITFLNDSSWQLREAFFGGISALALFVGRDALESYVFECVSQKALSDSDACVRAAAARCLASLARNGLLRSAKLRDACDVAAQLLVRPEPLVRRAAAQLLCDVAGALPLVDQLSFVLPRLAPLCREPLSLACLAGGSDMLLDLLGKTDDEKDAAAPHYFVSEQAAPLPPQPQQPQQQQQQQQQQRQIFNDLQFALDFESYANLGEVAKVHERGGGGGGETATTSRVSTSMGVIEGLLVSHFAEHRGAVRHLSVSSDERFFVSGGADGSMRVFDCARLEKNIANRARLVVQQPSPVSALTTIDGTHSVGVGTEAGALLVYNIEHQTSADGHLHKYHEARCVRTITGGASITGVGSARSQLAYCTASGAIVSLDMRSSSSAVSTLPLNVTRHGTPTSLLLDPRDAAWMLVGTSRGRLALYDRRSSLPLWTRAHPLNAPMRRLRIYSGEALRTRNGAPAALYSCADGIVEAIELSSGRVVLALAPNGSVPPSRIVGTLPLASAAAPLAPISAESAAVVSFDDQVVTSDATFGLNVWSVRAPLTNSRALSISSTTATTTRFLQAGPHTYYKETLATPQPANPHNRNNPNSPLNAVTTQHHDVIGDVAMLTSLSMLVSGARDGVIKVWR